MEKNYDIVLIGSGRVALSIAQSQPEKKKAVIKLANPSDVVLAETLDAFTHQTVKSLELVWPPEIDFFEGPIQFQSPQRVQVGDDILVTQRVVLAMGSELRVPQIEGLSQTDFKSVRDAFNVSQPPATVTVLGAGPLGVGVAQRLQAAGSKVTLISNRSEILPHEDPDVAALVRDQLQKLGVKVLLNTTSKRVSHTEKKFHFETLVNQSEQKLSSDELVLATGVKARLVNLNLNDVRVCIRSNGSIAIDEDMQTSEWGIWAAGSVTGASTLGLEDHQAQLLATNTFAPFFAKTKWEKEPLPFIMPMNPPLARLGMTEQEAQAKHKKIKVAKRVTSDGMIKLIAHKKKGSILGAHVVGNHAAELILFLDLCLRAEITLFDLMEPQHYPPITAAADLFQVIKDWIEN